MLRMLTHALLAYAICYITSLCLLSYHEQLQRHIFYLNALKVPYFVDTTNPAKHGFQTDRVHNIFLRNGTLHGWFFEPRASITSRVEEKSLVIYLHGTVGTIALPKRLTTYRLLTRAGQGQHHVLAFDYRGFGLSAGTPSESGLIQDCIDAVVWAQASGFDVSNITLFGHSLGAAVALGAAHKLALQGGRAIHIKKVVAVAGFSSVPSLMTTYKLGGIIPILGPLRLYPMFQKWFISRIIEHWNSDMHAEALATIGRTSMVFAHAMDDLDIPSSHSLALYDAAMRGLASNRAAAKQCNTVKLLELEWGGHNRVQWNDAVLGEL